MGWFRSHHGAPTDPKWLAIGHRASVLPVVACALWWALLDFASQHQDRGSVAGFDTEAVAAFFGVDEDDISRCLKVMRDKGMIVDERIVNWEKRQPKRERPNDSSTERVRQHRARNATRSNATPVERDETPGNALEESRGEEMRDGGEIPSRDFPPPVEMQFPKPAREAGHYQPSEAELEHGRAQSDAEYQERRRIALAWRKEHPDELVKIEAAVDRELARSRASPEAKVEIRKSKIMAECHSRAVQQPALAAAS